jgi:hypothetical protein
MPRKRDVDAGRAYRDFDRALDAEPEPKWLSDACVALLPRGAAARIKNL